MKKLFVLQSAGTAGALAAAYLVLLVPDSTLGYLLLSLLLMYAALFCLSFTLAAVAGALVGQTFLPAGEQGAAGWSDLLRLGWRGWWRVAAVVLATGGVFYGLHRAGWLRPPVWALISLLVLIAIPLVLHRTGPTPGRIPKVVGYAALGSVVGFAAWKIASSPAEMSRPWMEIGYLGLRVLVSFLVANLACVLLLAAGSGLCREQLQPNSK